MSTDTKADASRRDFLKLGAAAAPAAAVVAATGTQAAAVEVEDAGTGLRKTAHVKAYLESARF